MNEPEIEKDVIKEKQFSKGQPCLRASALIKRYGFGEHFKTVARLTVKTQSKKNDIKN